MILISLKNGSLIVGCSLEHAAYLGRRSDDSRPRWEDALQGDAEIEPEVGHHVVVRLAAARGTDRLRGHRGRGLVWAAAVEGGDVAGARLARARTGEAQLVAVRRDCGAGRAGGNDVMGMRRDFALEQRDERLAARLPQKTVAQPLALSLVDRNRPLQVGQREGALPIPAIECADQR